MPSIGSGEPEADAKSPGTSPFAVLTPGPMKKPDLDDREYRVIRLPNNIVVLLIHDPTTEKAAAALDVHVGLVQDPASLPGLAHFCEHLLFMGTKKYPKESEYLAFLAEHSGRLNAFTASTSTNYYFEVDWKHLDGALDRFAQFFITPLFSADAQNRELNAIHSEHAKNIDNDDWRMHQLDKSLANPLSSHVNFSTGNIETLKNTPLEMGVDPRAELLKWYDQLYLSNIMKACILLRHSLDELAQIAAARFLEIKDKNIDQNQFLERYKKHPYLTPDQLGRHIRARPVKNTKSVKVAFFVPMDGETVFRHDPGSLASYLVGHESKGSLFYYLSVTRNWANLLTSYFSQICEGSCVFEVEIDLTEEGYQHRELVLIHVFQYLNMLKGLSEHHFSLIQDELAQVSRLRFRFREKSPDVMSTVSSFAGSLQNRFLHDANMLELLAFFGHSNKVFNYDAVQQMLKCFVPHNMMLFEFNHAFEPEILPLKEKWYGTHHSISPISDSLMEKLRACGTISEFHLPPIPNPYIPKNLSIVTGAPTTLRTRPLLAEYLPSLEIWYKPDDRFRTPKGAVVMFFMLPNAAKTPANDIYGAIFKSLLSMKLNDAFYQASMVNMRCDVYLNSKGFELLASGYSDRLLTLVEAFVNGMVEFVTLDTEFNTPAKFDVARAARVKKYRNSGFSAPYTQLGGYHRYVARENTNHPSALLKLLVDSEGEISDHHISYNGFQNYLTLFLKQCKVKLLVAGNFKEEAVGELKRIVQERLFSSSLGAGGNAPAPMPTTRFIELAEGEVVRYETACENTNSGIFYFFQVNLLFEMYRDLRFNEGGALGRLLLAFEALKTFLKVPVFEQLRTKEQLGYVVFASLEVSGNMYGYKIMVQSSVKGTYYLESRVKEFLKKGLYKLVHEMTDEEFTKVVNSLRTEYQHALDHKSYLSEAFSHTVPIFMETYHFGMTQTKLDRLNTLKKEDVIAAFDRYLWDESTAKRLILHLKGKKELEGGEGMEGVEGFPEGRKIEDVYEFKRDHPLASAGGPFMEMEKFMFYESKL